MGNLSSWRRALGLPLLASLMTASVPVWAESTQARIFPEAATSQEYKIVIKPDGLSDFKPELSFERRKGFAVYWDVVKKVAADNGLEVREKKHAMREKKAILQYLDDAKYSLDSKGYILRVVQMENNYKRANKVAITLKFRSPDAGAIKPDTIEISSLRKAETEYQDDVIGFIGAEPGRNLIEHSPAAKVKGVPYDPDRVMLGQYAALFPTLGKLGLDPSTKLMPVAGSLRSVVVEPGSILFKSEKGKEVEAEVQMTYWAKTTDGAGILGEISYTLDLEHAGPRTIAASQKFFGDLQKALAMDIMPGATKVAVIYKLAKKQ